MVTGVGGCDVVAGVVGADAVAGGGVDELELCETEPCDKHGNPVNPISAMILACCLDGGSWDVCIRTSLSFRFGGGVTISGWLVNAAV